MCYTLGKKQLLPHPIVLFSEQSITSKKGLSSIWKKKNKMSEAVCVALEIDN